MEQNDEVMRWFWIWVLAFVPPCVLVTTILTRYMDAQDAAFFGVVAGMGVFIAYIWLRFVQNSRHRNR